MHQHLEVRIGACPDYVWAVLTDVARWPDWSPSLRAVEPFDGGPLVVGGGVRVRQRHLPDRDWRVTELRPHRGFTWRGTGLGSASSFRVRLGRSVQGRGTDLVVDLDRSGWVGGMLAAMTASTSAAPLDDLLDGLRRRCESGQCAPAPAPAVVGAVTAARPRSRGPSAVELRCVSRGTGYTSRVQLVPSPHQVVREARMLTAAPRGLLALGRIWALPGVRVNHREEPGDPETDAPPPLPSPGPRDQALADGHGPMLHRVFTVHVPDARLGPRELVAVLVADINAAMIPGAARFDRVTGSSHALTVGDEYVVRIPGPWDGPVRVVDRTDEVRRSSFRLATLEGHVEAGQIEFAAEGAGDEPGGDATLQFTITTWARAGDVVADLVYNRLRLAKNLQFQLWVHCCVRAAEIAGGEAQDGVEVVTRTVPWSDELAEKSSGSG